MENTAIYEIKTVRFHNWTFHARAECIHRQRHVYILTLPTLTASLVSRLPPCVHPWLGHRGFLPRTIILKEQNPERPSGHSDELCAYNQLQSLQGRYIPQLYGEATVHSGAEEVPALLIEHIEGSTLNDLPLEHLASDKALQTLRGGRNPSNILRPESILNTKLLAALELACGEIASKNLMHGDPRSDNFMATVSSSGHYRVWAIDFEFACPPEYITNHMEFLSVVYELADFIAPDEIVDK